MEPLRTHGRPWLLAFDPGVRTPGIALFRDGRLVDATSLRVQKAAKGSHPMTRALLVRDAVRNYVLCNILTPHASGRWSDIQLVVEFPQAYHDDHRKVDKNDLITLASVCGTVSGLFEACQVTSYLPRPWKGTISGDQMVYRIESTLKSTGEIHAVTEHTSSYRHNAIDAAGLGLFYLGRLNPKRVIAR